MDTMTYRDEESYLIAQWDAQHEGGTLCSDCPPSGYPTDSTRCEECPRKSATVLADIALPTYCGCNELLQDVQQLEAHVERGCWGQA